MTTTFAQPTAKVQRDRYGRPLVIPPGGGKPKSYRRCTKFIDVLDDPYNLTKWKQRQVAHGLAIRHDLILKAASASGDKRELDEVCEAAMEAAGSSTAATSGTALHKITEAIDRGEDPLIPPSAQPDVDAYRQTTAHLAVQAIEVFVVHDDLQVGGTFDRIIELEGRRYVADIKTGRIDYGGSKFAMQMAVYAHSHNYDPATGQRSPLGVDTSRGLIIHLPTGAGECSLHWADLDAGWQGVEIAMQVWEWRARKGLLEATAPDPGASDALYEAIAAAASRAELEQLWANNQHMWTADHTDAVRQRLEELQSDGLDNPK